MKKDTKRGTDRVADGLPVLSEADNRRVPLLQTKMTQHRADNWASLPSVKVARAASKPAKDA